MATTSTPDMMKKLANPFNQQIPGSSPPPQPTNTFSSGSNYTIPGQNVNIPPKPVDESYRNLGATDQFKLFQSDPTVAQHEYNRINDAMNLYKANNDTNSYNAANNWMNQFNTATNNAYKPADPAVSQYQQYTQKLNDAIAQLQSFSKPMNYDPTNDPQAIAYKQFYDNLGKQNSQNAMETMNSRGILNSTITAGEVAKAEQDAGLQYGAKVADLGNQFYQRQQDQFNNALRIADLLGGQAQRGLDNAYRDKTYDRGVVESDRSYGLQKQGQDFSQGMETQKFNLAKQGQEFTQQMEQIKNGQWDKTFDFEMKKWADQQGLDWANYDLNTKKVLAQLAIEQQNANSSSANAATSAGRLAWDKDPNNPDNQYKQSMIEKNGALTNKYEGQTGGKTASDFYKELDSSRFLGPETTKDKFGNVTKTGNKTVTDPVGLEGYILSLNLPDSEARKLYMRYGLKWGE